MQNIVPQAFFVIVMAKDQFLVANCLTDQAQQFWIRLFSIVDLVSLSDSGPALAIRQIAKFCLGNLEACGNEVRDCCLPKLGVPDVCSVVRKDDSEFVAKLQNVNRKTVHV